MNKIMSLTEAVKTFIPAGSHLAIGGFTASRNPMAITYEIIRQGIKDLHLYVHSHGQSADLLIGAGCVKRLEIAYAGMGRYAPTMVRFAKAVENGDIEWEDYSNYQMALRFFAGSLGIPFMVTKTSLGSDIISREGFKPVSRRENKIAPKKLVTMANPFSDKADTVVLLPAINADVALIHAHYAGAEGTVRIEGLKFTDVEIAKCASRLIVTCEEIVPESYLRQNPDLNCIPFFLVDAIIKAPYGAHPTGCYNLYDTDAAHLNMYRKLASDDVSFRQYLADWVNLKNHDEYLAKIGVNRLTEIKASIPYGFTVGLNRR